MSDTKKSNSDNPLQFYERNPSKNEGHKKPLQFYKRDNFKIKDKKNKFLIFHFNFI